MTTPDLPAASGDTRFVALVRMDAAIWAQRSGARPGLAHMLKVLLLRPGFHFTFWHRVARAVSGVPGIGRPLARIILFMTEMVFASEINLAATIGGGLYVPHPFGIVVGEGASIGTGVTVLQNVTIGERTASDRRKARIGDGAYLGAGAIVLGPVEIGAAAIIGANAVVLIDVPAGATAVGNPARILAQSGAHGPTPLAADI